MVPIRCCRRDFFRRAAVGGLALRAGRMERVGLGIAASCYCLFYLGTVLRRTTRESIPAYQRGILPQRPLRCC